MQKASPELARGERLAMAGGVSARDRHPASGRAGSGVSEGGRCGGRAAERLGVGLTLLYELVARFRRRPQTSSLVPCARGRVARSRSLDPRVEALVASAIKEVYLRPERPRLIDLWRAVRALMSRDLCRSGRKHLADYAGKSDSVCWPAS